MTSPPPAKKSTQFMAYGDDTEGNFHLQEVTHNLRQAPSNEEEVIRDFWQREVVKCNWVKERRVTLMEAWMESEKRDAIERAKKEGAAEEQAEELARAQDEEAERKYQDLLVLTKAKLGFISQEELEKIQEERKKGKR